MRAYVHVFSGTGNTLRAASLLTEGLSQSGCDFQVQRLDYGAVPPEGMYDLHIFAFPVYAFAPPDVMMRYIRKIPYGHGTPTVIISTHGDIDAKGTLPGWPGQALAQARRMLQRRGYNVFLTESVGFPENLTQGFNTPKPEEQAGILALAEVKIKEITKKILTQETNYRKIHILHHIWCWPVGLIFNNLGRRFLGKLYISDNKCTACGKCVHTCPVKVISLFKGRPYWNFKCEGCQRCMNICPVSAIQVSYLRLLTYFGVFFLPYNYWWQRLFGGKLVTGGFGGQIGGVLTWIISFMFISYLLDKVLFVFEHVPGLKRLCELNYTKNYRRYLEPHFNLIEEEITRQNTEKFCKITFLHKK